MDITRALFLLLIVPTFLTGCSRVKLAYNYADWLIEWRVDDMFDLDDQQEEWLEKEIDQFFAWHRKEEIPKLIGWFKKMRIELGQETSEERLLALGEEFRSVLQGSLKPISEISFQFLVQLKPRQIDHFENYMKERNEEIQEDLKSMDEDDKLESTTRVARVFFGDFSEKEEQLIKAVINENPYPRELWWRDRIASQTHFLKMMRGQPLSKDDLRAYLSKMLLSRNRHLAEDHIEQKNRYENQLRSVFAKILNQRSEEARKQAISQISILIGDLEDLIEH